jgi:hypothetical protein
MKPSNLASLVSGLAAALLILSAPAAAAEKPSGKAPSGTPARVVKLRVDNVALYDSPNGAKVRDYPRAQFKPPWPVVGRSEKGFLQVQVDGATYWVRGYAVETDAAFGINADCGAVASTRASNQHNVAATRGIGDECKQK